VFVEADCPDAEFGQPVQHGFRTVFDACPERFAELAGLGDGVREPAGNAFCRERVLERTGQSVEMVQQQSVFIGFRWFRQLEGLTGDIGDSQLINVEMPDQAFKNHLSVIEGGRERTLPGALGDLLAVIPHGH